MLTLNKKLLFIICSFIIVGLSSCSDELNNEMGKTNISKLDSESVYLPFENEAILKGFDSDPQILGYSRARKLTLLELIGSEFDKEMKWEGHKFSQIPVVLYGFDNKPKYYDFIVLDAEGNHVGTVTAYARKSASTMIKELSTGIKDYKGMLSKSSAGISNSSLFVDWAGNTYTGLLGKSGNQPTYVVSNDTGEFAAGILELEKEEIIEEMKVHILEALLPSDLSIFDDVEDTEENKDFLEEVEAAKTLTVEALADSMHLALQRDIKNANAFWDELEAETADIDAMDDNEILDQAGKSLFSRLFRRIFSGVKSTPKYLTRYVKSTRYDGTTTGTRWCGPWVCGYILYVKTGENKYKFFENCASTYGEFGVLNFALRLLGRPMTPAEMAWSMPIASKGKVRISPFLWFTDFAAYDQISHYRKPALRLCAKAKNLHWQLAYGTYQSGNYFWRNYYFLQRDNHSRREYKEPNVKSNYSRVDWWNPWLMVWD